MKIAGLFFLVLVLCLTSQAPGQTRSQSGRRTIGNTRQPASAGSPMPARVRNGMETRDQPPRFTPASPLNSQPPPASSGGIPFDGAGPELLPAISPPSPRVRAAEEAPVVMSPEIVYVTLSDFRELPEFSGYDFSDARLYPFDNGLTDICFEGNERGGSLLVYRDTDIQDLGSAASLVRIHMIPPDGWSLAKNVPLYEGHTYLVWTWDNQYYQCRVTSLSRHRLTFDWVALQGMTYRQTGRIIRDGVSRQMIAESPFER